MLLFRPTSSLENNIWWKYWQNRNFGETFNPQKMSIKYTCTNWGQGRTALWNRFPWTFSLTFLLALNLKISQTLLTLKIRLLLLTLKPELASWGSNHVTITWSRRLTLATFDNWNWIALESAGVPTVMKDYGKTFAITVVRCGLWLICNSVCMFTKCSQLGRWKQQ